MGGYIISRRNAWQCNRSVIDYIFPSGIVIVHVNVWLLTESGGADLKRKGFLVVPFHSPTLFVLWILSWRVGSSIRILRLHRPSICCLASFLDKHFTGTGMVGHLTLTALEIQRDQNCWWRCSNSIQFSRSTEWDRCDGIIPPKGVT